MWRRVIKMLALIWFTDLAMELTTRYAALVEWLDSLGYLYIVPQRSVVD